jgi:zincin-like metallopeptidase
MPARSLFHSSEEYYATEFHELAHSTWHLKRLHRENFDNPVSLGSEPYSKKELIAEMTTAMLCGIAGIEQKTLKTQSPMLKRGLYGSSRIRGCLFLVPHRHRKPRTLSKTKPARLKRQKHRPPSRERRSDERQQPANAIVIWMGHRAAPVGQWQIRVRRGHGHSRTVSAHNLFPLLPL